MWDTGWLSVAAPWRTVHGAHEFETEPSTWFQQSSQRDSRRIRCSRADALAQTLSRPHSFMASKRCMMYPLSPEPTPSFGVISCSSPPFSALAASFLKHKNQILRLLKCCCPRRAPGSFLQGLLRRGSPVCQVWACVCRIPHPFTLLYLSPQHFLPPDSLFIGLFICLLLVSLHKMSTPRWCVPGAQNSLWCRISMKSPF